ncbi:P-loop containing nucleoside triphosphate hydrolase protein, partial [Dunaliella salina]
MGKQGGGKQRTKQKHEEKKMSKKSLQEAREIEQLEAEIAAGAPAPGTNPLASTPSDSGGYASARAFEGLPLSQYTKNGLKAAKFVTLTAVQRATLPHALAGRDILGAAKTGSGKTLAFLIPLVEKLYRLKWTRFDGLGGLVLTPTRELAMQIFEELRKIGKEHDLSAGLLIGGKKVKEEQAVVNNMNILVATPGRLLQHMDETAGFDATNVQILVLDEADRILDMGFSATVDAILENLPREGRQTMLFSATQTKSVKDLARLSLTDPEYLAIHAEAATPTPLKLQQAYAVVPAPQKMDVLWSFIKSHLHTKTIIFLSTCKQVRFVYEALKKLRPGVPLRALHGGMKQMKRMAVFYEYCQAKSMMLFATDIAARGLDFPKVDWVLQFDCPEDVASYIHRVGRTARYMSAGRALTLLMPSEQKGMLAQLEEAKVPIRQIKINPAKQQPIGPALQALLSKSVELKEFAQRAMVAYVRSEFLQPNKAVHDVTALPAVDLAQSWGLLTAPRLRFLKKVGKQKQVLLDVGADGGGALRSTEGKEDQEEGSSHEKGAEMEENGVREPAVKGPRNSSTKFGEMEEEDEEEEDGSQRGKHREPDVLHPAGQQGSIQGSDGKVTLKETAQAGKDSDEEEDFFSVKRRNVFGEPDGEAKVPGGAAAAVGSGAAKKKKMKIKVGRSTGQRTVFDESGEAMDPLALLASDQLGGTPAGSLQGEGNPADHKVDEEGLYVVADAPEDRFRAAADFMRRC